MINKLNIAIAGLGTVGSSTINLIEKNKNILYLKSGIRLNIVGILAKNKSTNSAIIVMGFHLSDCVMGLKVQHADSTQYCL